MLFWAKWVPFLHDHVMQDKSGELRVLKSNLTKGLRITFVCKTSFQVFLVAVANMEKNLT